MIEHDQGGTFDGRDHQENPFDMVRENLKEAMEQLRETQGVAGTSTSARRMIWSTLSLLDRQEEIFRPAIESNDLQEKHFALSQLPELAGEEELPILRAAAKSTSTPKDIAELLVQAHRDIEASLEVDASRQEYQTKKSPMDGVKNLLQKALGQRQEPAGEEQTAPNRAAVSSALDVTDLLDRTEKVIELAERLFGSKPNAVPLIAGLSEKVAEEKVKQTVVDALDEQLSTRLRYLGGGPGLENYEGFVCVSVLNEQGDPLPLGEAGRPVARPGQQCLLSAWFQPEAPVVDVNQSLNADSISIHDGQEAAEVTFQFAVDSDSVRFPLRRQSVSVQPGQASPVVSFQCFMPESSAAAGIESGAGRQSNAPSSEAAIPFAAKNEVLWVQVFQKGRLIQALPVLVDIEALGAVRNVDNEGRTESSA